MNNDVWRGVVVGSLNGRAAGWHLRQPPTAPVCPCFMPAIEGYSRTEAADVTDHGNGALIVGTAWSDETGAPAAVRWPPLGPATFLAPAETASRATVVNAAGKVAGVVGGHGGPPLSPVTFAGDVATPISVPGPGHVTGMANDPSGTVVGVTQVGAITSGFQTNPAAPQLLPPAAVSGGAAAISNDGKLIAGTVDGAVQTWRLAVNGAGRWQWVRKHVGQFTPGAVTRVLGMSPNGKYIVGEAMVSNGSGGTEPVPFVYENGAFTRLAPVGRATAANDVGDVIGEVGIASTRRPTMWVMQNPLGQ
jgi:hypothetical protein